MSGFASDDEDDSPPRVFTVGTEVGLTVAQQQVLKRVKLTLLRTVYVLFNGRVTFSEARAEVSNYACDIYCMVEDLYHTDRLPYYMQHKRTLASALSVLRTKLRAIAEPEDN